MKYVKPRRDLIFIINPLTSLISFLLFCFYLKYIPYTFYAFWAATAAALFLILLPLGNTALSENADESAQHLPWQQWFLCILLLELTLLGSYSGICFINGEALPINISENSMLFSQTLQAELWHYGLFPWSLYAVIAVGMGFLAYRQNTHAYFSNLLNPFIKHNTKGTLGLISNICMRRCTLFAISLSFIFIALLFISLFLPLTEYIAHGFQTAALIVTLIFLAASLSNTLKKMASRIFAKSIAAATSFTLFCILLGLIILILSMIATNRAQNSINPAIPSLIQHWINFNNTATWSIFSTFWWIFWTPLACAFIARVSKGYKIRHIIIGILILPIMLGLYFKYAVQFNITVEFPPTIIKILSLVSFLILLPLLLNHSTRSQAVESYFPAQGIAKYRDQTSFFEKIIQLTFIFLYLYLVIGINGPSLFSFTLNCLAFISLIFTPLAILKNIIGRSNS
ncbi:MAG: hypothetical protein A3E82_08285 [Gammaproteobacteria bacterium RIFCSPHIGHO2_12_FULL_38_11]|nr:MAG: hypothetical protein A3E82_08285 [Gammaproteobacteria bacterium RIFCSPHIGHO2_12_FULL_38_11]